MIGGAAIAVILAATAVAPQEVSADAIRSTAQDVLGEDMYHYEDSAAMAYTWAWILGPIEKAWDQLTNYLESLFANAPAGTQTVLYIVLSGVLLLIVAHGAYVVWRAVQPARRLVVANGEPADQTPRSADLMAQANALAEAGNYVDASRALYESALLMLEEKRRGHLRRGLTATEYLRTFQAPWVREHLGIFVHLINWKWYRARSFDADDYARCRDAYASLAAKLRETA